MHWAAHGQTAAEVIYIEDIDTDNVNTGYGKTFNKA